jgi:hypothetical protein
VLPFASEIQVYDFPNTQHNFPHTQHNFYKLQRNIYLAGKKRWVGCGGLIIYLIAWFRFLKVHSSSSLSLCLSHSHLISHTYLYLRLFALYLFEYSSSIQLSWLHHMRVSFRNFVRISHFLHYPVCPAQHITLKILRERYKYPGC